MALSKSMVGIVEALLSATFFGLIPMLFLPIYKAGISPETSLVYRFALAALMMLIPIKLKKHSLRIPLKDHISICLGGFAYYLAAIFLFSSFTHIASGVAITIFFTNPIFVMILMALFYKEKVEGYKIILSIITLFGIALFSGIFDSKIVINFMGILLVILASIAFAFYVISLFKLQCVKISKETISFYLFAYCAFFACIYSMVTDQLVLADSSFVWLFLGLSALVTAVLPNILLMSAIKKIGSVLATILGVMDPITAVIVGVLVFGETMNIYIVSGIIIVLVSVMLITIIPLLKNNKVY